MAEASNSKLTLSASHNKDHAGLSGHNLNPAGSVNLVGLAGFFDGNASVTGDIFLADADCAEHFDIGGAERLAKPCPPLAADEGLVSILVALERGVLHA